MEEQVNIPVLSIFSEGVTLSQALSVRMVMTFAFFGFFSGKSIEELSPIKVRRLRFFQSQLKGRNNQEKLLGLSTEALAEVELRYRQPYRKPTQVGKARSLR